MKTKEILKLIDTYWTFDNGQRHTHTWHDKQDLLKAIEELLRPSACEFCDEKYRVEQHCLCEKCRKKLGD